jgi:cell division protein FtsB
VSETTDTETERPTAPPRRRGPLERVRDGLVAAIRGVRNAGVEARSGQRPLVIALVTAVVAGVVMLSGPAERYLDGRTRVEALRGTADALDEEIARLEREVEDLEDPANLELRAREEQGMVRPGEVPYTLVPPEVDRPRITSPRATGEGPQPPWYARAWDNVRSWF